MQSDQPRWGGHILDKRLELDERERQRREILLKEHNEQFRAEKRALAAECVSLGGHRWDGEPPAGSGFPPGYPKGQSHWCAFCRTFRNLAWWNGEIRWIIDGEPTTDRDA